MCFFKFPKNDTIEKTNKSAFKNATNQILDEQNRQILAFWRKCTCKYEVTFPFFLLKITIKSKELTPLPPCPKTFTFFTVFFFFCVLDPYRFLDMNSDYSLGKVTHFFELKFGFKSLFFENFPCH